MDLGDRMKAYEEAFKYVLPIRMPAIIRLDGKAFHTLTKDCRRPYDEHLRSAMVEAASAVLRDVPGRMAYCQSDEVSILLVDYNRFDSQQWFGGGIQKIVSVAASIMGVEFSKRWRKPGAFDARVFVIPERDVKNYFVWRQQDAMRNAVSMAAQAVFSPKQLHGKHSDEMIAMLKDKAISFEESPTWFRLGTVCTRDSQDGAPHFSTNRAYLDQFLTVEEE